MMRQASLAVEPGPTGVSGSVFTSSFAWKYSSSWAVRRPDSTSHNDQMSPTTGIVWVDCSGETMATMYNSKQLKGSCLVLGLLDVQLGARPEIHPAFFRTLASVFEDVKAGKAYVPVSSAQLHGEPKDEHLNPLWTREEHPQPEQQGDPHEQALAAAPFWCYLYSHEPARAKKTPPRDAASMLELYRAGGLPLWTPVIGLTVECSRFNSLPPSLFMTLGTLGLLVSRGVRLKPVGMAELQRYDKFIDSRNQEGNTLGLPGGSLSGVPSFSPGGAGHPAISRDRRLSRQAHSGSSSRRGSCCLSPSSSMPLGALNDAMARLAAQSNGMMPPPPPPPPPYSFRGEEVTSRTSSYGSNAAPPNHGPVYGLGLQMAHSVPTGWPASPGHGNLGPTTWAPPPGPNQLHAGERGMYAPAMWGYCSPGQTAPLPLLAFNPGMAPNCMAPGFSGHDSKGSSPGSPAWAAGGRSGSNGPGGASACPGQNSMGGHGHIMQLAGQTMVGPRQGHAPQMAMTPPQGMRGPSGWRVQGASESLSQARTPPMMEYCGHMPPQGGMQMYAMVQQPPPPPPPMTTPMIWRTPLFQLFCADASRGSNQPNWWYMDPKTATVCGPHSAEQMILSYAQGQMPDSQPVCGTQQDVTGPPPFSLFESLGNLMSKIETGSHYQLITLNEVMQAGANGLGMAPSNSGGGGRQMGGAQGAAPGNRQRSSGGPSRNRAPGSRLRRTSGRVQGEAEQEAQAEQAALMSRQSQPESEVTEGAEGDAHDRSSSGTEPSASLPDLLSPGEDAVDENGLPQPNAVAIVERIAAHPTTRNPIAVALAGVQKGVPQDGACLSPRRDQLQKLSKEGWEAHEEDDVLGLRARSGDLSTTTSF